MIRKRFSVALLLIILIVAVSTSWAKLPESEDSGIFSKGDTTIARQAAVSKLLVVDGDAIIDGKVGKWVAVIRGNLIIRDGAAVTGKIFVLSGEVIEAGGAHLLPEFQVVLLPGSPLLSRVLWFLLFGAAFSVMFNCILIWAIIKKIKTSIIYSKFSRYMDHPNWTGALIAGGLLVSGLFLVGFIHLAVETNFRNETEFADQVVIWLVRCLAGPLLDKLMIVITTLGSGYTYILLGPIAIGVLLFKRHRHESLAVAVCLSGSAVLNYLLKNLFERARPDMFRVISETGYSFPSGHAMVSLCFYGMLTFVVGRYVRNLKYRLALYVFIAIMLALIGISRIYLGVHYPSDVLAGYVAGAMWLAFCVALLWWWEK